MSEQELVVQDSGAMQPAAQGQSATILAMVERVATDPNSDIGKIERLLEMHNMMQEKAAEQAFRRDMARLQEDLPVIDRKGQIIVSGVVRSSYARYEDIKKAVTPIMADHGFSSTFKSSFGEGKLVITGTISHSEGHQESTSVELPFDASGSKNAVQSVGSSIQYGKRYALCMLLDIATGGEDDDAQATDDKSAVEGLHNRLLAHNEILRENMASVLAIKEAISFEDYSAAKEAWGELSEDEQRALWVATTKGGIFTTSEREAMKSAKWVEA